MANQVERDGAQEYEAEESELHPWYFCTACGELHSGWDFCEDSQPDQCQLCDFFGHKARNCDATWADERLLGRWDDEDYGNGVEDDQEEGDCQEDEGYRAPEDGNGNDKRCTGVNQVQRDDRNADGRDGEQWEDDGESDENEVWQPYRCRPCGMYHDARHFCQWSEPRQCFDCLYFGHVSRECELNDY